MRVSALRNGRNTRWLSCIPGKGLDVTADDARARVRDVPARGRSTHSARRMGKWGSSVRPPSTQQPGKGSAARLSREWQLVDQPANRSTVRPMTASFKDGDWLALVSQLQGNYSRSLYGAEGLVEARDLALIWLPLLDGAALLLLARMGVCAWEPAWTGAGAGRSLLPLHAPHSTVDSGLAVWRHVAVERSSVLPSHAWVEVTHAPRWGETTPLPWFYAAHGSGVSLNLGRTVGVR